MILASVPIYWLILNVATRGLSPPETIGAPSSSTATPSAGVFVDVLRQLRRETGFLLIASRSSCRSISIPHQARTGRRHQPLYAGAEKAKLSADHRRAIRQSPPSVVPQDAGAAATAAHRSQGAAVPSGARSLGRVHGEEAHGEAKLDYIHTNPLERGLAAAPGDCRGQAGVSTT